MEHHNTRLQTSKVNVKLDENVNSSNSDESDSDKSDSDSMEEDERCLVSRSSKGENGGGTSSAAGESSGCDEFSPDQRLDVAALLNSHGRTDEATIIDIDGDGEPHSTSMGQGGSDRNQGKSANGKNKNQRTR